MGGCPCLIIVFGGCSIIVLCYARSVEGIHALKGDELKQILVANFLLYVALRLMLTCLLRGLPATLEHPQAPHDHTRATIWRLPWLQQLEQHPGFQKTLIRQAEFGAPSSKPTHLGLCHLRHFQRWIHGFKVPVNWKALEVLKGRTQSGQWQTSKAKAYPEKLNQAIAWCHVQAYWQGRDMQAEETGVQIDEQFQDLDCSGVAFSEQTIQPDFHRLNRPLDRLD